MIVVFAVAHDPMTRASRWVALRTCERLTDELRVATAVLDGDAATRGVLEQTLTEAVRGFAFFGHGDEERLHGADGPVLDIHNIGRLKGRWVHAFACRAGTDLASAAAMAGVSCFVGYESSLIVEWDPDEIPTAVRPAFAQLVTQTTLELARGVHDADAIGAALFEVQAAVISWCDEHPDEAGGLEITAQQLLTRLVLRRSADAA